MAAKCALGTCPQRVETRPKDEIVCDSVSESESLEKLGIGNTALSGFDFMLSRCLMCKASEASVELLAVTACASDEV